MKEKLRFLGLDVHAETIAVAVAEPDGEVRSNDLWEFNAGRVGITSAHPRPLVGSWH
jgi:hypothetical protein